MDGCIFCKISRREIPAQIVAESSKVIAFRDIQPQAPVHILIIPKEHVFGVLELQEAHAETWMDMLRMAQSCARSEGVDKSGFRLAFNYGPNAGQAVGHLHMHLLGKRKLQWPPG